MTEGVERKAKWRWRWCYCRIEWPRMALEVKLPRRVRLGPNEKPWLTNQWWAGLAIGCAIGWAACALYLFATGHLA